MKIPLIPIIAFLLAVAVQAAEPAKDFRVVDPANVMLIDTRYGQIVVELAPGFAPNHVARIKALIHARFYDGLSFYRVVDGFVAQGGVGEEEGKASPKWPPLKAEFDRPLGGPFTPLGNADLYAPEVGFEDGFPVARDPKAGREWIIHCPGTFAFARGNDPDSATTEFYIVIGEAPRRLDRNLTAFGRVLSGMQYLQKLQRGNPDVAMGVIADPAKRDTIIRVRLASELPPAQRPTFEVMRTDSKAFAALLESKRHPAPEFYGNKPFPILDICGVTVPVKVISP